MRKVIFKERQTGATTKALSWIFEGSYKWAYIVPTRKAADLIKLKLLEQGVDSRLAKWIFTERQLIGLRGHFLDRIVIDELGYFQKPIKLLRELLVYRSDSGLYSDLYIIMDNESFKLFTIHVLEELLRGVKIYDGEQEVEDEE